MFLLSVSRALTSLRPLRAYYVSAILPAFAQDKAVRRSESLYFKALPKMAKAAKSTELKTAFQDHLEQTKEHVERLTQVFDLLGEKAKGKPCKGMAGLVEEGQEVITEGKEKDEVQADLALIAAAQKVEHYEISAYGTTRAIAEQMARKDVVKLLTKTLEEEEKADELLTELAKPLLNEAEQVGGEEEVVGHRA